jgi:membrane protease YdiL (CAAX protease family)
MISLDVPFLAASVAYLTACCEEIAFRGLLPHIKKLIMFEGRENSALACASQAGLSTLGHTSPKVSIAENATVASLQFIYGLWTSILYLVVGGDNVPLLSHA